MGTKQRNFPHRQNTDGSYDSICPSCLRTIGTKTNEAELAEEERRHVCAPEDLLRDAQWMSLRVKTPLGGCSG
jgi:hypothetical protein